MGCDDLAARIHDAAQGRLADGPSRDAARALLQASRTAVSAAREDVLEKLFTHAEHHAGAKVAPIAGRTERTDPYFAALINGSAARAAGFGAFVALAETSGADGRRALAAYALGLEVELRLRKIVSPSLFEMGWDIEAVCGVIGATVVAGLLVALDPDQLRDAIGIAASETLGHRRALGMPSGALHAGKAASNATIAALLARRGFTGSQSLDAYAGFFTVFFPDAAGDIDALSADFGTRWNLGAVSADSAGDAGDALADAIGALAERSSCAEFVAALTRSRPAGASA